MGLGNNYTFERFVDMSETRYEKAMKLFYRLQDELYMLNKENKNLQSEIDVCRASETLTLENTDGWNVVSSSAILPHFRVGDRLVGLYLDGDSLKLVVLEQRAESPLCEPVGSNIGRAVFLSHCKFWIREADFLRKINASH